MLIIAAVAAAGAATLPASASHRPQHQPDGPRAVMLRAGSDTIVFGRAVTLSGKVTGRNNSGQQVVLRADEFPFDGFAREANATTDRQGDFSFRQTPPRRTRYQARSGNDQSEVVTVGVRIRTSLALSDATPSRGERVRFAGRACPEHDGALVRIQRRTRTRRFATVRRTRLSDTGGSCSSYSRRVPVRRDGVYRAVVSGDADHANGISPRRRANVPR
jgi:hypothetical protein